MSSVNPDRPPGPEVYQAAFGPQGWVRPPMPQSVRSAIALMSVGVVLTFFQTVVMCGLASGASGSGPFAYSIAGGFIVTSTGGSPPSGAVTFLLVGGVLVSLGWLWMAAVCRRGRNWGRVVSTVFFGLGVLALSNLLRPGTPGVDAVFSVVISVVGLLAIVHLWSAASGPYFKPPVLPPPYRSIAF